MMSKRWIKSGLSLALLSLVAALALSLWTIGERAKVQAVNQAGKVLILSSTVIGGAFSMEAQAAAALGYTVEVVDAVGWGAKTQADFASYRALILGDPNSSSGGIGTAVANKDVWGPVVNGNVIIIGTDAVGHSSDGGDKLTEGGIKFAVDQPGKTGMYITLSEYYDGAALMTPVPLLDAFSPGGFTVRGVGCYDNVHIVATHPALTGITDATLSNWGCSVHEAFDKWPVDFQVLAIAKDIGSAYTAPDGTVGTPYILARGVTVISDIKLTPETDEKPVGTNHTVTAKATTDTPTAGTPVVGTTVYFNVVSGPNAGTTGTGVTNDSGEASFTYTSNGTEGTDFITAKFVDASGKTQTSNTASVKWVAVTNRPPVAKCKDFTISEPWICAVNASIDGGSYDPDGDAITMEHSPVGPYPIGVTLVTLTVKDSKGLSSTCTAKVTVLDVTPPTVSNAVNIASLWPPNHDLINVGLRYSASDNCSASADVQYQVKVYSNEDDETPSSDGTASPDAKGLGAGTLRLRAERKGDGSGRVYLIVVTATDAAGNVGVSCTTVVVPHSQSKAAVDAANAAAAAAKAYCLANSGAPPTGYFVVGDGPVIGPKQ